MKHWLTLVVALTLVALVVAVLLVLGGIALGATGATTLRQQRHGLIHHQQVGETT